MRISVASLHRYPVKSMLGEALESAEIDKRGVAGDRRCALVERDTGLVVSAKQAHKWGLLLQCSARRRPGGGVAITLPDGSELRDDDPDVDVRLSAFAGREVALSSSPPAAPKLERWWPDVEGLAPAAAIERAGTVTPMASAAPATFFDYAPLHLVTTSTLRALRAALPAQDFAAARFRPNIVLDIDEDGFVENTWVARRLRVGDVMLEVLTPTPRCAVPAQAHGPLPADREVLRTIVAENRLDLGAGLYACAGVYARVVQGGRTHVGDAAEITS